MTTVTVTAVSSDTATRVITVTVDLPSAPGLKILIPFQAMISRRVYYRLDTWLAALRAIIFEHTVRVEKLSPEATGNGTSLKDEWGGAHSQVTLARGPGVTSAMLQQAADAFKSELDELLAENRETFEARRAAIETTD